MRARLNGMLGATLVLLAGCKVNDVLNVPPPATQFGTGLPQNQHDAEFAYHGAKATMFAAVDGSSQSLLPVSEVLTDEFSASGGFVDVDARYTSSAEMAHAELSGDQALAILYKARSSLLLAATALEHYEPDSGQFMAGEALALVGYIELVMAEDYCAGVTLSYVPDGGGIIYGHPLTTDSLFGTAETHFASALAHAHGNATVQALASVGLGRTRLNRAHYAEAAAAVSAVPTSYVYAVELQPDPHLSIGSSSLYADLLTGYSAGCAYINPADNEGTNGLNFLSARDQRLVFDSTLIETCDKYDFGLPDSAFYYPVKFGVPTTAFTPLATGVEARLIEAEAALASNGAGTWASDLNALRAAAPSTYLALVDPMGPLTGDSTTGANASMQVDVMFRERAFWLFGLGTRLGDMRRLVRQYHRDPRTVFPIGPYLRSDGSTNPVANFGRDVSITLPSAAGALEGDVTVTNPYYKGCISSPGTA